MQKKEKSVKEWKHSIYYLCTSHFLQKQHAEFTGTFPGIWLQLFKIGSFKLFIEIKNFW